MEQVHMPKAGAAMPVSLAGVFLELGLGVLMCEDALDTF
jgi:hypothetical protein